ncbi:MAG: hypothetical protein BJ554DRAFT_3977 [Olpidium bornovanus]|uniref:Glucose receptor Git3 N-terminal domain-containing protein n=1 Tax=Olpidium bornovanus TaxID=278681 RepID=A0A8H7ZNH0_9FUNG|nr:MAG: hypothetical protein BJ554DRAFT_3977 [Olpidium bornovanus]
MDSLISPTAISAFNLTGAVMSAFGSLFVVAAYFFVDFKKDALRKRLILSLASARPAPARTGTTPLSLPPPADLVNSVDNTASGFAALHRIPLRGPWCTVNGFIGQWSIVTSDLTVFAIAVATLMSIKKPVQWHQNFFWAQRNSLAVVLGMWAYGLATALGALSSAGYVQSSPNWCWVSVLDAVEAFRGFGGKDCANAGVRTLRFHPRSALRDNFRHHVHLRPDILHTEEHGDEPRVPGGHPRPSADVCGPAAYRRERRRPAAETPDQHHRGRQDPQRHEDDDRFPRPVHDPVDSRLYNLAAPGQSLPVLDLLQGLTQWIGFANGVAYNLNLEVQGVLKGAFTGARHPRGGETERRAATP